MIRSLRNSLRLLSIGLVLARHNALFIFEAVPISPVAGFICSALTRTADRRRPGQRLRAALEELGPTYVKLGQMFSTRADLIGEELALDLSYLQDKIPPFPTAIAREIVETELGKPITELFVAFEDLPAAAASIAQVHFARTHDGKDVAVKILRPRIEHAFARDLELFYWLAETIEYRLPHYRRLKPREVVNTFKQSVDFELDLRYEAAACDELRENLKDDQGFCVPGVYWMLTSRRVLTSERIFGLPISDVAGIKAAGIDVNEVLRKAAFSFFHQVFRDGYFHADLHPGNLFVLPSGDIAAVDFGIMGRLSREDRIYLALILRGFLKEDYKFLARVHVDAGYVPPETNVDQFALSLMAIARPIIGKKLSEISVARLLGQLFNNAETFQMEVQTQLLLLQKSMMVAEGVGRMLNPDINMWAIAEPLVEEWGKRNLGPAARIQDTLHDGAQMMRRLPRLIEKLDRGTDEFRAYLQSSRDHQHLLKERLSLHKRWNWFAWAALLTLIIWLIENFHK